MDMEMQKDIHRLTGIKHHLIPCKEPAAKLMKLLLDNDFASGMHFDFLTAWHEKEAKPCMTEIKLPGI